MAGPANIIKTSVDIAQRQALDVRAGDTVAVTVKIIEEKEVKGANKKMKKERRARLQKFEGLVIARKHGKEAGGTFTVRKIASGVGVEKIFPLYSANIDKIELVKRAKVRRAKLYYIRDKSSKEIRKKMKNAQFADYAVVETPPEPEIAEEEEIKDTTNTEAVETTASTTEIETTPEITQEATSEEKQEEKQKEEPKKE
ncbi:MAG: 50S ribosomal protein L19 [Candidatus Vogelbacteria bacterium CG10_big_fil_rev_8_21_14_0_10_45_14]|uniref:Large ribosomal subunit protein bL19 n=1 Tax=Candidatus Vogelbacteria bacterium CG10_big_fil_rev_8_21_14_0_10_45_14 TaxID=1975042 RepID=A0A2H0RJQ7_9BACT|nr:MAG: 50S ribosomal protein L19 [Candidatus Vogelbacteria bacterium CG10_big_fil_rev_8_21_14_0_10_45_14]